MKFNCEIFKIKERKIKDKLKYVIVGYRIYPNVSKELALYLAVKFGGGITGLDKDNAPCHPNEADKVVGFSKWYNDIAIVAVHPVYQNGNQDIEGLSLIPRLEYYSLPIADKWFCGSVERIIRFSRENILCDFSIEASHLWGPNSLIPKGYEHVNSGNIQEGDYYFRYDSYGKVLDNWTSVDVSWSSCKPGGKVEYRGILGYRGDHGYHKDGETTFAYDPFVIRKIKM